MEDPTPSEIVRCALHEKALDGWPEVQIPVGSKNIAELGIAISGYVQRDLCRSCTDQVKTGKMFISSIDGEFINSQGKLLHSSAELFI